MIHGLDDTCWIPLQVMEGCFNHFHPLMQNILRAQIVINIIYALSWSECSSCIRIEFYGVDMWKRTQLMVSNWRWICKDNWGALCMALSSRLHTKIHTQSNDQYYNLVGKALYMFTLLFYLFFFIGTIQVLLSTIEEGVDYRMGKVYNNLRGSGWNCHFIQE